MASSVLPSSATINSKPYTQRIQTDILSYLEDQVRGLDVLDVGCCDHDVDNPPSGDRWMHARLGRAAKSILGMDILERDCAKLRARGYDVVAGDACTVSLDRTFDVVVAGEIIEHVENPGQLVRNLAKHVRPGGKLILTTPHIHFALHFFESIFCDPRKRWHPQHCVAFEPFTLRNLTERCGLRVETCGYVTRSRKLLTLVRAGMPCWGWLSTSIVIVAIRG
jgi:2-polyprenyl-3-methyl-5-hydroxy-6-metoxy-1,4-benzoquinol methylase